MKFGDDLVNDSTFKINCIDNYTFFKSYFHGGRTCMYVPYVCRIGWRGGMSEIFTPTSIILVKASCYLTTHSFELVVMITLIKCFKL